jgi:hypothetical protein
MHQHPDSSPIARTNLAGTEKNGRNKKSDLFKVASFAKRRRGKENLSGKAMHDAVPACAQTHGLKMFQVLEEG